MCIFKVKKSPITSSLVICLLSFSLVLEARNISKIEEKTKDSIFTVVDKMPEFPGGDKALLPYLFKYSKYTADDKKVNKEGKAIVQFIVSKTGKIEQPGIIRSLVKDLDKEALKIVKSFPDWVPGEKNGEKVSVYKAVPITFKNLLIDSTNWTINEKTIVFIDSVRMPENFNINIFNTNKILAATTLKPFPKEAKETLMKTYGKQAANGVVYITSNKYEMYFQLFDSINCNENAIVPSFIGGNEALTKFISDSIQYPFVAKQLNKEGKVFVNFNIDKSGNLNNVIVAKPVDYFLDKEAVRVINSSPKWIPGKICGQVVEVNVTMPVNFKLNLLTTENVDWKVSEKTVLLFNGKRLPTSFNLEWLDYSKLSKYKTLKPGTIEEKKKLIKEYGKDAINGVVIIEMTE